MENGLGKELSIMCNLSETVEARGIAKGLKQGIEEGKLEILFSLIHDHVLSSKDAAVRVDMSEEMFLRLTKQK